MYSKILELWKLQHLIDLAKGDQKIILEHKLNLLIKELKTK